MELLGPHFCFAVLEGLKLLTTVQDICSNKKEALKTFCQVFLEMRWGVATVHSLDPLVRCRPLPAKVMSHHYYMVSHKTLYTLYFLNYSKLRLLENEISIFPKLLESLAFRIILIHHYWPVLRLFIATNVKMIWNQNWHFQKLKIWQIY